MKKRIMVLVLLALLVITFAGVSQARQGQMDDPYGLLQDESDFLTHPSQIAQGEGIRFYGDYRFTYMDVMDWDYDLNRLDAPLWRTGLFFAYDGMKGDYDGDEDCSGTNNFAEYELIKDLDNLDGEVQIAYRQEENENWQQSNLDGGGARKAPTSNVLKLLQTEKARIEWSTGEGVSVLFDL